MAFDTRPYTTGSVYAWSLSETRDGGQPWDPAGVTAVTLYLYPPGGPAVALAAAPVGGVWQASAGPSDLYAPGLWLRTWEVDDAAGPHRALPIPFIVTEAVPASLAPPPAPGFDHALLSHLDYATAGHTGFTPSSRRVLPGAGLSGGGDLSADRTLSLADTAVVPGSYVNAGVTVDAQGRITAASSGAPGGLVSFNGRGPPAAGLTAAHGAAALPANVALTDAANTFGAGQTINGPTPAAVGAGNGTAAAAALAATGGAGGDTAAAAAAAGGMGGNLTLTAGAGGQATAAAAASTGGVGGAVLLVGGAGGGAAVAGTGSNTGGGGSAVQLTAGAGGAATGATSGANAGGSGGSITVTGGRGGTSANGGVNNPGGAGVVNLLGGPGAAQAGGPGGAVAVTGGAGSTTGSGGVGGAVTLAGGNAGGDNTVSRAGGNATVQGGLGKGSSSGGLVALQGGVGGPGTSNFGAAGGSVNVTAGAGGVGSSVGGNGGSVTVSAGPGGASGTAGNGGTISFRVGPTTALSAVLTISNAGVSTFQPAVATAQAVIVKGAAGQSANLQEWQDSSAVVGCTISENGYFTTRKTAAPAAAELAAGEVALWLDQTVGATKLMIMAKDSAGTVRTAAVALA